ncbi:MAG: hypothetical protein KKB62_03020 [Nanoarchaeota archaeon]|nr:hypothetical protein [Nanoarchaeota archaeon]
MSKKKGLSTVVTTLIIVLLVLAAIAIIWGPIRNLLSTSTSSLNQASCFEIELRATRVINITSAGGEESNANYNVTLRRSGGASNVAEVGALLIFYSETANTDPLDFGDTLGPAGVKTRTILTGVFNANKVEVVPYMVDPDSGEQIICSSSTTFEFRLT